MSALRLSPEDQAEYDRRSALLRAYKEGAIVEGDTATARRCRQQSSALYMEYKAKQLPPEPEEALTLEERVDRIEQHLLIGRYSL